MNTLPEDIVMLIADFTDLNDAIDQCKELEYFRRSCYYHKLDKEQSLKYHNEDSFRDKLLKNIKYPRKQLSLNLRYTDITDVSALGQVHTLDLRYTKVTYVSALTNVKKLYIHNATDISMLKNTEIIN